MQYIRVIRLKSALNTTIKLIAIYGPEYNPLTRNFGTPMEWNGMEWNKMEHGHLTLLNCSDYPEFKYEFSQNSSRQSRELHGDIEYFLGLVVLGYSLLARYTATQLIAQFPQM